MLTNGIFLRLFENPVWWLFYSWIGLGLLIALSLVNSGRLIGVALAICGAALPPLLVLIASFGIRATVSTIILLSVILIIFLSFFSTGRGLFFVYVIITIMIVGGAELEWLGIFPLIPNASPLVDIVRGRGLQTVALLGLLALMASNFNRMYYRELSTRHAQAVALRANEEELRLMFEQAPIPMAIVALDGQLVRVNRALCSMLGYPPEALLQQTLARITHPEDLNKNLELMQQALRGEIETYQIEKRYIRSDGEILYGVLHGIILRDAQGQPRQILGQLLNVTESQKTEMALRASEARFRTLAENIHGVVYVCRNDARFSLLYVNDAIEQLTGYAKPQFLSGEISLVDLYHPEDVARVSAVNVMPEAEQERRVFEVEYRIRRRSGEWRWVEERGTAVRTEIGEVLLEGYISDITERKQAEFALRESEERFRLLAETVPSIVFICRDDERYTMLYLNDAVMDVTGYDKDEFLSERRSFVDLYHPAERAAHFAAPPVVISVSGQRSYQLEYRLRHASGQWRWVEERSLLITLPTGERVFHGILTDITTRKASEAELSQRLAEQTLLYEIGQSLASQTSAQGVQRLVCERITEYLGGTSAYYEVYMDETSSSRTDFEYWTERATANERKSMLGKVWHLKDPTFARSPQVRHPLVFHRRDAHLRASERELIENADGQTIVVIPAIVQNKCVGFFEVWDSQAERDFDERTLQLALTIGAQAASALENIALLAQRQQAEIELNQRLAEQTLLYELGRSLAVAPDTDTVFQATARYFVEYLKATSVYYLKYLPAQQVFQMEHEYWTERANLQERQSALGESWSVQNFQNFYRALQTGWPQIQTRQDADLGPAEREAFEFWNGQTAVVVPVMLQGEFAGYFEIWDSINVDHYDDRTLRVLLTIANQAAIRFENIRLVNELKQTAQRAQELATAAESANRLKTEIIANISHELRTPLTAIQGSLGLVLQGTVETPTDERYWLDIAYEGSERLLKLINALLNVARIEASQVKFIPTALDVNLLVQEVAGHIQPVAEAKGLRFHVPANEFAHWLWLDHELVRQVLLSLLQNAVKFTEQGWVEFSVRQAETDLVFTVRDTGIGLTPAMHAQLFRPFAQGDGSTTRRYGGFGVGLYTAQRLAELMGGRLEIFSSGTGQGTTVELHLPLRLAEAELSVIGSH